MPLQRLFKSPWTRAAWAVSAVLVAGLLGFNAWVPAGYHLVIASGGAAPAASSAQAPDIFSVVNSPWLSRQVLRLRGSRCDLPIFQQGVRVSGTGNALGMVVYLMGQKGTDQAYLAGLLADLLTHCDPNTLGEGETLLPLPMAIVFKRPDVVAPLLAHGARQDIPIVHPNERIRGKTSTELVDWMLANAKSDADKASAQAMRELLSSAK